MPKQKKAEIIEEAIALEKAGMRWEVKHVAALSNRSPSYIRYSSCPKHTEPGGPRSVKGRGKIVFIPAEVRTWIASLLDREADPRVRMSA